MKMKETLNQWTPYLEKEAELGNTNAMHILHWMHTHEFGATKDPQRAKHYAEMEANKPPFELTKDDLWTKPPIEV